MTNNIPSWLSDFLNIGGGSRRDRRRGKSFSDTQKSQTSIDYLLSQEERNWQEQMYNKYQSFTGQLSDIKAAGLNPAMMYDGVNLGSFGASSATAAAPQGDASTSNPALSDLLGVLGSLGQLTQGAASVATNTKNANTEQANVTGQNALRSEQIETERKKQDFIKEQTDALRFSNSTNPTRWTWEVTNQANKEAMAAADLDLKYSEFVKTQTEIDKLNNDKRIDNLRYDLDYKKTLSDIAVNVQNIKESQQRVVNLRAEFDKLTKEINIKDYEDTLNVMRITYGVSDDALALACDSIATNIQDDKQRAQFVASVRRMSVSKSVSAGNMWSFIDKYLSDLGMFGRAEWTPRVPTAPSDYQDLIPSDYSGE